MSLCLAPRGGADGPILYTPGWAVRIPARKFSIFFGLVASYGHGITLPQPAWVPVGERLIAFVGVVAVGGPWSIMSVARHVLLGVLASYLRKWDLCLIFPLQHVHVNLLRLPPPRLGHLYCAYWPFDIGVPGGMGWVVS